MLARTEVRTINCFPIVLNDLPSACTHECFDAIVRHLRDTSSPEGIKRKKERKERKKGTRRHVQS